MKHSKFAFIALVLAAATLGSCDNFSHVPDEEQQSYTAKDSTIIIAFSGNSAEVTIPNRLADYVTFSTNGAYVTVTQSDKVSEQTTGEITYELSGTATEGSFTLVGSYKSSIDLKEVTLNSKTGPALDIQNGKRIKITSKSGTVNTLADVAGGDWKGCLASKGHTEFKGKGTLNVISNTLHGIWSKEYMEVKNCTINVTSAAKDAINCNQYFLMESGEINLSGFSGDGIQVSLKTNDESAENTGNLTINGGVINIDMTDSDGKSLKVEGTTIKNGGEININ